LGVRSWTRPRSSVYLPPELAAPRRFYATTGISVTRDGVDHSEDVSLAARNALLNMRDHLTGRGRTPQQAYAICSVAVDLKISQLVDAPNLLVRLPARRHLHRQLTGS
jgi:formamidase